MLHKLRGDRWPAAWLEQAEKGMGDAEKFAGEAVNL
jgi:hypothetical protein